LNTDFLEGGLSVRSLGRVKTHPPREKGRILILILLGAPGAGKGTQAEKLVQSYHLYHLSTGDLLRVAVREGSELGRLAKGYMDRGELVPDDVILGIIRDYINSHRSEGILFDGFPRTTAQAEGLEKLLEDLPVKTIALDVPDQIVIQRLSSRRVCRSCGKLYNLATGNIPPSGACDCGGEIYQRDDDHAETIAYRLDVFHRQTEPIIDFYRKRGAFAQVDGLGSPDEIFVRLRGILD
ncbi:MAG: adenylate kinase, partial [Calditrichota bacterium]